MKFTFKKKFLTNIYRWSDVKYVSFRVVTVVVAALISRIFKFRYISPAI